MLPICYLDLLPYLHITEWKYVVRHVPSSSLHPCSRLSQKPISFLVNHSDMKINPKREFYSECTLDLKRIDVVFVTRIPIPNVQGQYFWWAICIDSNCAAIKAKNCIRNSAKNGSSQFQAPWDFLIFLYLPMFTLLGELREDFA